jgi:DNA modification methylase
MKHCWKSDDGRIVLYCGDCMKILSLLEGIDAVITDPPYGINREASARPNATFSGKLVGDEKEFDPSFWIKFAPTILMWGANNFSSRLPRGGWMVWDKRLHEDADRMLGSPFELAWTNKPACYKIIRVLHGGVINADSFKGIHGRRFHPTQKPILVMIKCMDYLRIPTDAFVLDPYMGSGSTGIACLRSKRRFVGIEIVPEYFEIAVKRVQNEYSGFFKP